MSRSGYNDDIDDQWAFIRWRGTVASAARGKRGQAMLKDMLAALDAMPEKRLIAHHLECDGEVGAIGSLARARGIDMSALNPEDYDSVAGTFDIASPLAQEIVFQNDEAWPSWRETPEERFVRMRAWIAGLIKSQDAAPEATP